MRIDPAGGGNVSGAQNTGQTHGAGGSQASHGSQTSVERDRVDLSGASSLIALSAGIVSPARQSKIAALTAQVQNGTYNVDPAQVASAIVNHMLGA
ncbi:MAG TPA: flagellar biosynthesis anti-sigma factor FlgM [Bryobacteraceae bacterium]|nr:flagellar biosynthesis anti-sigma factor FlgM [Bryobacteraceae bacterium]